MQAFQSDAGSKARISAFSPMDEAWWSRPASSHRRTGIKMLVEIHHKKGASWAVRFKSPNGETILKYVPEKQLTKVEHKEAAWVESKVS